MKMFRAMTLAKVAGISYRQVQYWDRTGLLTATRLEGQNRKAYSLMDLALGFLISALRKHTSIQKMRSLLDRIRPLLKEESLPTTTILFLPPQDFVVVQGVIQWTSEGKRKPALIEVGQAIKPLYDLANSAPSIVQDGAP